MGRASLTAGLVRVLSTLLLFGLSFAFVEAAVVVYLRGLYEPLHAALYPDAPSNALFPILQPEQLESAGPQYVRWMLTELIRELATLVMLGAIALAVARNTRQWFAAFMIAFGVWDIFFYVFLRVLIGWPASLWEWDLLFLLPVPWVGPVIAPVLVAASMIFAGVVILKRDAAGRPTAFAFGSWAVILSGGVLVVIAFCWDFRNIMSGGVPQVFNWPLLLVGEAVGLAAFLHAVSKSASTAVPAIVASFSDNAACTEESSQKVPIREDVHLSPRVGSTEEA
jgi:hypothetical protein